MIPLKPSPRLEPFPPVHIGLLATSTLSTPSPVGIELSPRSASHIASGVFGVLNHQPAALTKMKITTKKAKVAMMPLKELLPSLTWLPQTPKISRIMSIATKTTLTLGKELLMTLTISSMPVVR